MISSAEIVDKLAMIIALLVAIILHENAHGIMAYFMGDDTAKQSGRLSLNPLKHLSLTGTIMLILFKIGWAKPVPINPYNFKKRRLGLFLVSIAGITMNFLIAIVSLLIIKLFLNVNIYSLSGLFFNNLLFYLVTYNIYLAIFNLIPIPPLDGSKIIYSFLPYKTVYKISKYENYTNIIMIILVFTGIITKYINIIYGHVLEFLLTIIR